ncbi:MAG: flagellar basal body rod C-terminal domain-containing protein [Bryobacteraceae bacterium]
MQIYGTALAGLERAQAQVETAANRIAKASAPPPGSTPAGDQVDLSQEITGLLVAREAFEANLAVIDSVSELDQHLIDILA